MARASAIALAAITPTMTPPIRPGPPVAATASSASKPMPASASARDQPVEVIEMRARGDLRHHAAIGAMLGQLRQDQIGADTRLDVGDHRRGRLIAARLDPQHQHRSTLAGGPVTPAAYLSGLGVADPTRRVNRHQPRPAARLHRL